MILHHTVTGNPSGTRVALLHPVGIDLGFLAPLAALLGRHHQVMNIDLRGHGKSALLPLADSLDDFAGDVHDTLASTHFGPCAVLGFSFGGMTAQALALRHPGDVAALLPCACPATLPEERRSVSLARGVDAERDGMGAVIEATMQRWFTPAFRQAGGDAAARAHLMNSEVRGWAQGWRAISKIDTLPHLARLRVPALCIAGELDVSSTPQDVKRMADAIPGAQYQVIAGAPHMLFIEQAQAVADAILPFLGRLGQAHAAKIH